MSPANLKNPFAESCCDGGICDISKMSAQSCGCDPGINHYCQRHDLLGDLRYYFLSLKHDEGIEELTIDHVIDIINKELGWAD